MYIFCLPIDYWGINSCGYEGDNRCVLFYGTISAGYALFHCEHRIIGLVRMDGGPSMIISWSCEGYRYKEVFLSFSGLPSWGILGRSFADPWSGPAKPCVRRLLYTDLSRAVSL